MQKRTLYLFTFFLLVWFGAVWFSAEFGVLYLDEAWYLTASHLVSQGQFLYRDFAFTQGPAMPYVYGAVLGLIGTNLAIGRFISVALSALALALVLNISHKIAGTWAAVLAFALLLATPDVLYFLAIVKTYSLVATLTFLALAGVLHNRSSSSSRWPFLSTLVAGTAAMTRISFLLVVVFVFLFWVYRGRGRASGLGLLVVGLVALLVTASSDGNLVFDVLQFHLRSMRVGAATLTSTAAASLEIAIVFAPALVSALFLLVVCWRVPASQSRLVEWWRAGMDVKILLLLVVTALWIVHFIQAADGWEYQIPGYLLVVILLAGVSAKVIDFRAQPTYALLLGLSVFASSAGVWSYLFAPMWRPSSTLVTASQASELLAQRGRPGDTLLGGFNHLALASGLEVYPGNEMGTFSIADGSSPAETTMRHFLSKEAVTEALATCSATFVATDPVAIFRVTIPSIVEIPETTQNVWSDLLHERYRMIYSDRDVGIFERIEEKCNTSILTAE